VGSILLAVCLTPALSVAQAPSAGSAVGRESDWTTYGGNLASHRYSPLDQINPDNFKDLEIAWRLRTDFLGPRPDNLYSATPL
jgi:quinoprotein glucose dehydrogenase